MGKTVETVLLRRNEIVETYKVLPVLQYGSEETNSMTQLLRFVVRATRNFDFKKFTVDHVRHEGPLRKLCT
jgi:hypothetical protein